MTKPAIKTSKVMEALLAKKNIEGLMSVIGYVGEVMPNTVMLYPVPSKSTCLEIQERDIVHFEELTGNDDGKIRIYIPMNASIKLIQVMKPDLLDPCRHLPEPHRSYCYFCKKNPEQCPPIPDPDPELTGALTGAGFVMEFFY